MTNTPTSDKRPDVEVALTNEKHRLMPVVIDGSALVVRPEPATASGTPLSHAEKILHAMADRIEALEARQVKLEAVVEGARQMDAGWRGAGPAGQAIVGYWCECCGEGHAERPKILHSALCKIFQFNQRLAALGEGDG